MQFSRAMKVVIDTKNMTAALVSQYINSQQILSSSQGSMPILPNYDAPVGYGYDAAFIELSRNLGSYIRVAAVSIEGRMVGASDAFKYEQAQIFDTLQLSSSDTRPLMFLICLQSL